MINVFGTRLFGRIEKVDGSCVVTQMFHINFLPVFPMAGFVILRGRGTGDGEALRTPLDMRSVLVAYGRWWGVVGSVALFALSLLTGSPSQAFAVIALLVLVPCTIAAHLAFRLSPQTKEQRRAYAQLTGFPVDPVILARQNVELRDWVHRGLMARGASLDAPTYRHRHDPSRDWVQIALDPMAEDAAYLCAALVLTRLDRRGAGASEGAELDRAHEAIWEKLSGVMAAAPKIDWSAWNEAVERVEKTTPSDVEAKPAAPAPPPRELGRVEPGRAFEQGFDVRVRANDYRPPTSCASCGAPAEKSLRSQRGRRAIEIPYCVPCHGQAAFSAWNTTHTSHLKAVIVFATGIFGAVGFIPFLPLGGALAVGVVGALAGAVALQLVWPIRKRIAPATATIDGARVVGARGEDVTLFCTHPTWAADLARAHGTTPVAKKRAYRALYRLTAHALLVAPVVATVAWFWSHPKVAIDNGTGAAVQVWVDGKPSHVVPDIKGRFAQADTELRLSMGHHELGWSPVGASAPTHVTQADIHLGGDYLFDPDSKHCYLLDGTVYGEATVLTSELGPIPLAEFYSLRRVDTWFADNPPSLTTKEKGEVRLSLQRAACEGIDSPPCPAGERARYWDCVRKAVGNIHEPTAKAEVDACVKKTSAACGGGQ